MHRQLLKDDKNFSVLCFRRQAWFFFLIVIHHFAIAPTYTWIERDGIFGCDLS